jgi:hypothetical protein
MNLDKLCAQYERISKRLELLKDMKECLRVQLMAADGQVTDSYSIKVTESTQERVESLKAIKDKSESLFKALHEAGCIKQVPITRLNIKRLI